MSDTDGSGVLSVGIARGDTTCPACALPLLALSFESEAARGAVEHVTISRFDAAGERGERDWTIRIHSQGEVAFSDVRARLNSSCVWTRGVFFGRLAEPCLMQASSLARAALKSLPPGEALTLISCVAAHALEANADTCRHALAIDGHLCSTLTLVAPSPGPARQAGVLNVAELPHMGTASGARGKMLRVPGLLPVDLGLLEAAPDEPTLSFEELSNLTHWETMTCERARPRRRWQHLILVSHQWSSPTCPGDEHDLRSIQKLVTAYVNDKLRESKASPNPRIKATGPQDFGVWIDFMMVPNDLRHGGRAEDCQHCSRLKDEAIKRINGLLTLATVLKYNANTARGWILQEVSLNAHADPADEKSLSHRDRAGLILSKVEFSDEADGARLRCYEFLRLGQTPRVWPTVNVELLERWEREGQYDEGSFAAWPTLTEYARSFGHACHRLKRLMAEVPQAFALAAPDTVLDLADIAVAVEEQCRAMECLAEKVVANDIPGAASDPEHVLSGGMAVAERGALARALQLRQLVAVGMGLRAEWRSGAGLACWVSLTVLTEALTVVKFMARLKDGQVIAAPAKGNVALMSPKMPVELFEFARRVARDGVGESAWREAFTQQRSLRSP